MSALVKVVQKHLMTIYIARSIAEHSFQVQRCVKFIKVYRLHTPVTRRKQNVQHRNVPRNSGQTAVNHRVYVFKASLSFTTLYALHLLLDRIFGSNYIHPLRNERPL